jgi:hypothetical protein
MIEYNREAAKIAKEDAKKVQFDFLFASSFASFAASRFLPLGRTKLRSFTFWRTFRLRLMNHELVFAIVAGLLRALAMMDCRETRMS